MERRPQLPIADQPPVERADAARNRQRLLDAAALIVETKGVDGLALDEVARVAGVGVGTAYRRFGDVGGLAYALLEGKEVRFQEAFLAGPPPLGPGAAPADRIHAFLHALLALQEEQWELRVLASSKPSQGYGSGPYLAYHLHLTTLLRDLRRPGADPAYVASALLALIQPVVLDHQRRALGFDLDRIRAGVAAVLAALVS